MSPEAVFAASLPIGCVATVIGCSLTVTVFTRLCGPRVHGRPCALSPGRSLGASLVGGAIGVVFVTPLINALLHQLSGGAWGRDFSWSVVSTRGARDFFLPVLRIERSVRADASRADADDGLSLIHI